MHDPHVNTESAKAFYDLMFNADETYAAARDLLGDVGVVELVALCGFYALVSFVLNAFEVPTPDGSGPVFLNGGGGDAGSQRRA